MCKVKEDGNGVNKMPYVQTSITLEEQVELHTRAIRMGKPIQQLVYRFIREGLDKLTEEDKANVGREKSKKAG
jgi:hypothetical protein